MTIGAVRQPTGEKGVRWRFLALTGLRWLPVGFLTPVLVLLPLSRGLSLPEVGLVTATYGATTALLELPTGGLADSVGRRTVLVASSLVHIAFFAVLLVATGVAVWAVAMSLGGVARALDSGPLEAWYVDESRRLEPGVELRAGLSAAGVVEGVALAASAVTGGVLPAVVTNGGLVVIVWAALAAQTLHLLAVFVLMPEHRRAVTGSTSRSLRSGPSQLVTVVSDGLRFGLRRGPIRMLLLVSVGWGVALGGIEILWQPRFVTLLGGDPGAPVTANGSPTVLLGVLLAGAFLLAAVGSFCTPAFTRLLGGSASRSALASTTLQAGAFAGLAASFAVLPAAGAFLLVYLVNGLRGPLHSELLHEHVSAERRSTMLSVESLSAMTGGFACTLALPVLAAAVGIPWAWALVALLVALSALAYLAVPDRPEAAGALHAEPAAPVSANRPG